MKRMDTQTAVLILYACGSVFFLAGSLLSLYVKLRG